MMFEKEVAYVTLILFKHISTYVLLNLYGTHTYIYMPKKALTFVYRYVHMYITTFMT